MVQKPRCQVQTYDCFVLLWLTSGEVRSQNLRLICLLVSVETPKSPGSHAGDRSSCLGSSEQVSCQPLRALQDGVGGRATWAGKGKGPRGPGQPKALEVIGLERAPPPTLQASKLEVGKGHLPQTPAD